MDDIAQGTGLDDKYLFRWALRVDRYLSHLQSL